MLGNIDIHQMLANFSCKTFPGRSTVHQHYGFLGLETIMKLHQLILKVVREEEIDDFCWQTMDSTAIASASTWPVDSSMLYRLLEKSFVGMQTLVKLRSEQKGWKSKVAALPLKGAQNLLHELNLLKQEIDYSKGELAIWDDTRKFVGEFIGKLSGSETKARNTEDPDEGNYEDT